MQLLTKKRAYNSRQDMPTLVKIKIRKRATLGAVWLHISKAEMFECETLIIICCEPLIEACGTPLLNLVRISFVLCDIAKAHELAPSSLPDPGYGKSIALKRQREQF